MTRIFPVRLLRKNQTPWERKLWSTLRNRGLVGVKFRRQYKIGNYTVDFCCVEKMIVIELDGSGHLEEDNVRIDVARDEFLKHHGYVVLRFWNNEVDNNFEGVIERIIEALS